MTSKSWKGCLQIEVFLGGGVLNSRKMSRWRKFPYTLHHRHQHLQPLSQIGKELLFQLNFSCPQATITWEDNWYFRTIIRGAGQSKKEAAATPPRVSGQQIRVQWVTRMELRPILKQDCMNAFKHWCYHNVFSGCFNKFKRLSLSRSIFYTLFWFYLISLTATFPVTVLWLRRFSFDTTK